MLDVNGWLYHYTLSVVTKKSDNITLSTYLTLIYLCNSPSTQTLFGL